MRLLPEHRPTAKIDGDKIILAVESYGTRCEIALSVHDAMRLGQRLIRVAAEPMDECRPQADLIQFPRLAAGGAA